MTSGVVKARASTSNVSLSSSDSCTHLRRGPAQPYHTGYRVALGRSLKKRSGRLGRRIQPFQWHETHKVIRPRTIVFQFRIVEKHDAVYNSIVRNNRNVHLQHWAVMHGSVSI